MASQALSNVYKLKTIVSVTDPAFGARGDNGTTDDSAAFTAAINAGSDIFVPRTPTVDPNTDQTTYRLDSEIRVPDNKRLRIARGVILKRFSANSSDTAPVVTGLGIGWEIEGGTIQTENASPQGVVRLGHLDSTDDRNAWWWRFRNCTVLGRTAVAANDIGVWVPNGQVTYPARANYFGTIQNINIQYADFGLLLDEMANAHNVDNITFWICRTSCLRLKGCYGNNISNLWCHTGFASGVIAVDIRNKVSGAQDPRNNNVIGVNVETNGAADIPLYLDTAAAGNVIVLNNNTSNGPTNNATAPNTVLLTGTSADYSFSHTITVFNSAGGRATIRAGGTNVGVSISSTGSGTIQFLTNNSNVLALEVLHRSLGTTAITMIGGDGTNKPTISTNGQNLRIEGGGGATDIEIGKALVALGGGAAPTLGTIGGSGPATAGQNSWLRLADNSGNAMWVPVWK